MEGVIAEAQPLESARTPVVDEDVGLLDEVAEGFLATGVAKVEGYAFLVPVDAEVAGADLLAVRARQEWAASRERSPVRGRSILMTSAPMSARMREQKGPATMWVASRTRIPVRGRGSLVVGWVIGMPPEYDVDVWSGGHHTPLRSPEAGVSSGWTGDAGERRRSTGFPSRTRLHGAAYSCSSLPAFPRIARPRLRGGGNSGFQLPREERPMRERAPILKPSSCQLCSVRACRPVTRRPC